ncbi:hypothetical protein LEP1GSC016_3996 [Leptospira borgpetersenii serovar Hardjo-bovis str. Sponselee]|uniref:Uncharacterized protein n=1 Tax=Leptospira borgpetersenii serovar Hardjo-bovis str. Sponselee TaxID=1303729 RepID=M6C0C4_LEPBO|nr:hypothetical protein LEP1GSC016_3996 [Leptospira borgpetersenii serovar Hardjo-bovis str. Sponselee]
MFRKKLPFQIRLYTDTNTTRSYLKNILSLLKTPIPIILRYF